MTIQEFIDKYREAFGEAAPLPIALGYSDTPASEVGSVPNYKMSKEMVIDYVDSLGISISEKPYLNFVRVDQLEKWDAAEAILFFATPDMLSGLCTWAFYDNNSPDAVTTQFAPGCAAVVTFAVNENRKGGRRCFLGMVLGEGGGMLMVTASGTAIRLG